MSDPETTSAKDWTDRDAFRSRSMNSYMCDYAHPNTKAGLHKHWIRTDPDRDIVHCMACKCAWHRPEPDPLKQDAAGFVEALRGYAE